MSSIKSLNEALDRLDTLMKQAGINDEDLKKYICQLHAERQNLTQKLNKMRLTSNKADTTSSMHSKLTDALRE